jgi:geranylgeranyl reductase family protein
VRKSWDVAVVGTGPAGGAAAIEAARAGAKVLVLERASIPRYKRCGGGIVGLSERELERLGVDIGPIRKDVVSEMTFTLNGRRPFTRRSTPFLSMANRSEFDELIVGRAAALGAQLRTGTTVTDYQSSDGRVLLHTSGGPVLADRVVAADGSQGRAAAFVGVRYEQVDVGLEGEFPIADADAWRGRVLLDWGPIPGSYGWVFPKNDSLTVGVIAERRHGTALRRYFADFVHRLGLDETRAHHCGGHLTRVRAADSPLRRGGVLVAGDAAGLLDPWTREGISFALRSGAIAGRAAVGDPAEYDRHIHADLLADIDAGRTALRLFESRPRLAHLGLRYVPGAWDLFVEITSGRTRLGEQARRRIFRALSRALGARSADAAHADLK